MSKSYLNFMPLIELYLDQQRSIKDSFAEVKHAEDEFEQLTASLQGSELKLKQIDKYLQMKGRVENLKRLHEESELDYEKTKLDIMEILLAFPNLNKIQLNKSKINPQYLSWDVEQSTFKLSGYDDK